MKKPAKWLSALILLLILLLTVVVGYVVYVFVDYHRIEDLQPLEAVHQAQESAAVAPGVTYKALTYNVGFGAYTPEFDFFMDGGSQSWAASEQSVRDAISGAGRLAATQDADFVLFEEVDLDSTRSWHVDQKAMLDDCFPGYDAGFAVNYDSPFLFFPLTQPHGKSLSGLAMYARFPMHEGLRRSLPITDSVMKLTDLDRCYMRFTVPMSDGRSLVMYTIHMTAYSSDATVRDVQLAMLIEDMSAEYAAGNAVICGGDFNMEMVKQTADENTAAWALPLERANLRGMINVWDQVTVQVVGVQYGSCRDAGTAYHPGQTAEWTLDSFIVSPNVIVEDVSCVQSGFTYSDHDPVLLTFHIE